MPPDKPRTIARTPGHSISCNCGSCLIDYTGALLSAIPRKYPFTCKITNRSLDTWFLEGSFLTLKEAVDFAYLQASKARKFMTFQVYEVGTKECRATFIGEA